MKQVHKKCVTTVALTWAGSFLLFLFTYMLTLSPQKTTIVNLAKKVAEKEQLYNLTLEAAQEENKVLLKEQIEALERKLRNYIVNFEDAANLTFDISQIANNKQVGSFSISTKDYQEIPDCTVICENAMSVDFIGSFNQFATLLNALERNRPIIFVDEFTITRSEKSGLENEVKMKLSVFVKNTDQLSS